MNKLIAHWKDDLPAVGAKVVVNDNSFFEGEVLTSYISEGAGYIVIKSPSGKPTIKRAEHCLPYVEELVTHAKSLHRKISEHLGTHAVDWGSLETGKRSKYYAMVVDGVSVGPSLWVSEFKGDSDD